MQLKEILHEYNCIPGERFSFSSKNNTITYDPEVIESPLGKLSLLHEIAHLKLGHFCYTYDLELFKMEIEAWEETKVLAEKYNIPVNLKYIENCLSSYDKWLTKRATCPRCNSFSLQKSETHFFCVYCESRWKVSANKDKRIMRKLVN